MTLGRSVDFTDDEWHSTPDNNRWDELVWDFWAAAQGWAINKFGYLVQREMFIEAWDIQRAATDALHHLGQRFGELDVDRPNRATFWAFAKHNIEWEVRSLKAASRARERQLPQQPLTYVNDTGDEFENLSLVRTVLNLHTDPSMLLKSLVEAVSGMRSSEQMMLALRFFEEMSYDDIGAILRGDDAPPMSKKAIGNLASRRLTKVTYCILVEAMRLTMSKPPDATHPRLHIPREQEDNLVGWVAASHGCDINTYLKWVRSAFRSDVSYVCDIIDHANGVIVNKSQERQWEPRASVRRPDALKDEVVAEIRQRLRAGHRGVDIAADYGICKASVSLIKNRKTYDWVA